MCFHLYVHVDGRAHGLPIFLILLKGKVGFIARLSVVFSEMVSVLEYEFDGSVLAVAANAKVKPVFGIVVQTDIGVALQLDCDGSIIGEGSVGDVAAGKAAVQDNTVVKLDVGSVGVPGRLPPLVVGSFALPHRYCAHYSFIKPTGQQTD